MTMIMKTKLTIETINSLIETQLFQWDLANRNFSNLRATQRKNLTFRDLSGWAQLNPARIVSSAAKTDTESIKKRECFLCASNRPAEQITIEWVAGWHLLMNPFPILPVHFTIVNPAHTPQGKIPLEMAAMAEVAPDLVFFYNGARAGASAPDHQHAQAVLKSELPLIRLVEECHSSERTGWISSEEYGIDLPFHFVSAIISPDIEGMQNLSKVINAFGVDDTTGKSDTGLVNAFMWISDRGLLRVVIVPRRRHRPSCYFLPEDQRMIISPGAIDMTGLVIVPRAEDFAKIDEETVNKIYSEVAFADGLPPEVKTYFNV